MDIKKFAIDLRNRLLNGASPETIAREINDKNFTNEQKRQIISYLQDDKISTESNNLAFLELVKIIKEKIKLK